jgi:hypothetical protein
MNGLGKAQARVNLLGQHEVARDVMILGTKHQPAVGRCRASMILGQKSPDDRKPPGPARLRLTQPQVR